MKFTNPRKKRSQIEETNINRNDNIHNAYNLQI